MRLNIEIYQWLVPLVSILFIIRTVRQYRRNRQSIQTASMWIGFWVFIAVLAMIPNDLTVALAKTLGFKSNISAIIFVALGILFSMVFYLSASVSRLESQVTKLVRKIAKEQQKLPQEVEDIDV